MVKVCTKCKIEKELTEFNKNKRAKDGLDFGCKSCKKEYNKANKEKIKEYNKANKERIKEYRKEYRKEYNKANKEKIRKCNKEYYRANKEYYKEYYKEWREANKVKRREYKREYQSKRRQTDPLFKMMCNLRRRTSHALKNKGYSKNTKTQEMLGVDWEICKAHIERKFTKGMNWSNQGEWHIDHIIPLSSAKTPERLKQLCHYTNLQPLWAEENLSKKDIINGQQTLLRI